MWPMEEYAISFRRRDWFSPPRAPTIPEVIALIVMISGIFTYEISMRGAIFCHVISVMELTHPIPSITPGNQK